MNPWYTETAASVSYRPLKLFFICLSSIMLVLRSAPLFILLSTLSSNFYLSYRTVLSVEIFLYLFVGLFKLRLRLFYSHLFYFLSFPKHFLLTLCAVLTSNYYFLFIPINCFWICIVESCPIVTNILFCWSYSTWVIDPACSMSFPSSNPVRRQNIFIYPF